MVQLKVVTYSKPICNVEMTLKKKTIISHRPRFFPSLCLFYPKSRDELVYFLSVERKSLRSDIEIYELNYF